MKIQFGSGGKCKVGFVNVDLDRSQGADVAWDMNVFPYPFENGVADLIVCEHTLEHILYPSRAIREFNRILRVGGVLRLAMPHFSHPYALLADLHVRPFGCMYFYEWLMDKKRKSGEWIHDKDFARFSKVSVRLCFPGGFFSLFSVPFNVLFGRDRYAQYVYECVFMRLYPAEEIRVEMIK